ncbi:MAG: ATP-binding cassette domain-containing protein [Limimaricola sp.]|uniref:ABC transporter ATP-binding protein n=1 Tax=Limimaricola sp. TaxID=2211665 RepID=UPI001DA952A1|nr:oligopeptide/dipeptide ABC transporter ATP-binding protein [Limimaricola sp.]MBI1417506.1 ATP-binding cassette domain-containing protein [Limimaricola sp.]
MSVMLQTRDLSKSFPVGRRLLGAPRGFVHALRPTSITVEQGETLGIVGESGCGKSTLARMLVGLMPPSGGSIEIDGTALDRADPAVFGRMIQYVFQDPSGCLNPRQTIRQILDAPLRLLYRMDAPARAARIAELLDAVNLRAEFLDRYPHEFSGGQAQRIGIARALAAAPRILVLDEPVSALDVSVQAQVLNLLADLKAQLDLTYLFISHDLAVVEAVSDRIVVLYFGTVVESGPAERVFASPRHPYTKLLADSAPAVGRPLLKGAEGELPDPLNPPPGCAFASRCPAATEICRRDTPPLRIIDGDQFAACHHPLAP